MKPYTWVSPGSMHKFDLAILEMRRKNKELIAQGRLEEPITEERIKRRYIEMGGLVLEVEEATIEENVEEKTEEKPIKVKKIK